MSWLRNFLAALRGEGPTLGDTAVSLVPVRSTDDSHDIPNAARTHDAKLGREAHDGMPAPLPPPAPPHADVPVPEHHGDLDDLSAAEIVELLEKFP